jgi:hypothetical protein
MPQPFPPPTPDRPDAGMPGPPRPTGHGRRRLLTTAAVLSAALGTVLGLLLLGGRDDGPSVTAESSVMTYLGALNDRDTDVVHDLLCAAKTDYLTTEVIADLLADWPAGPILAEYRVDSVEAAVRDSRDGVTVTVTVVHGGTDIEPHQHEVFLVDEEGLKLCAGELTFG